MMRKWKFGLCLMMMPYCVAIAQPATSTPPPVSPYILNSPAAAPIADAIRAGTVTPEQYFEAADAADKADDVVTATQLYKLAADGGHAEAQVRVAFYLFESSYFKEALEYYHKAAEQDNVDGMYGVGLIVMGNDLGARDYPEARKWFAKAGERGQVQAIQKLADAYISGGLGLDDAARSSPEALTWIKRAADIDYAPAIKALAEAYRVGKYGLTADVKQADDLDAKLNLLLGIKETKVRKKQRM